MKKLLGIVVLCLLLVSCRYDGENYGFGKRLTVIEQNNDLITIQWFPNIASKKLIFDSDVYDSKSKKWVRNVNQNQMSKPSYLEAHRAYSEMLDVSVDKVSGLISLKFEHVSPIFAQKILSLIIQEANNFNREMDIKNTNLALSHFEKELSETSLLEMKESINQLIETQLENEVITSETEQKTNSTTEVVKDIITLSEVITLLISNEKDFFLFLYGDPSQAFDSFLRPEKITFYNELFDKALQSVKYSKELTNRILKARMSIDYASLELHRKNNSTEYKLVETNNNVKSPDNELLTRLERFEKTAKENNITLMNEMGYTVSEYVYYFDKALDLAVKNNIAKYKPVSLLTKPTKYANEDPKVLTDGALGGSSFYSNWLGFVDNDMDAIVDLEKERFINSITTSFLQVTNHVVFFPPSVEFLISNDNKNWKSIGKIDNQSKLSKKSKVNDIQVFETNINTTARYIRVLAQNYGDAPYWHHAAGQPSWIFSDEIIIE